MTRTTPAADAAAAAAPHASPLNTGLDDFLAWAAARGSGRALPARPADAVLALLALRGADRRAGGPEPTPALVAEVLSGDLPALLGADEAETDAVPEVLRALADRVREAGRLNAKRHARLLAAVDQAEPAFRRAMADPARLTWHRWYASLLRADGTDPGDPAAVAAWLDAYARAPHTDRTALPDGVRRAQVADRTFAVRAALDELLLAAFARDTREPHPAGPLLPAPPLDDDHPEDALGAELGALADALTDRWSAYGLTEAFAGPHARLAPGPETLPHRELADRMLGEHLDYYGHSGIPLPPPARAAAPEEVRALLHAAPLPKALAETDTKTGAGADARTGADTGSGTGPAADTGSGADDGTRALAERCGFPDARAVWDSGTPQDLVELAADILAARAESLPAVSVEPYGDWSLDAAHLLYSLYERGSTPDSVVRKVADASGPDAGGADVAPEQEEEPVALPAVRPAAYETPSAEQLGVLLGTGTPTEEDRARLDPPARALAQLVDGLAGTGCVFRRGDAYGLTPLGATVMRHVLATGELTAPDAGEIAAWDARTTVAAVVNWPPAVGAATLGDWAARHGGTDEAWAALLDEIAAQRSTGGHGGRLLGCFALLERAGVPDTALRSALTHPVLGAHALRLLHSRGTGTGTGTPAGTETGAAADDETAPDESAVPLTARAVLLAEELERRWSQDLRDALRAAEAEEDPERARALLADIPPASLLPAFDAAAGTWPGGGRALVAALARAEPDVLARVLPALRDHHPDRGTADAAAHELKAATGHG
ncbi:hypothetical protein [Streptomyces sp. NPDC005805]|uniref:hypothetical protein n=1 Tax=Streptomyces sp. NPDC005805 TaxID=3157068 RepID=UPI00340875FE